MLCCHCLSSELHKSCLTRLVQFKQLRNPVLHSLTPSPNPPSHSIRNNSQSGSLGGYQLPRCRQARHGSLSLSLSPAPHHLFLARSQYPVAVSDLFLPPVRSPLLPSPLCLLLFIVLFFDDAWLELEPVKLPCRVAPSICRQ